ncbi:hypothetical protein [uncultured Rhodoblastus sp.]|uniref:hypothetical protein n=1 Tax=uncultured Rhodoblastus sp. TaxID=543037 RepID=UPI0025D4B948|nr:hypothetical protein [uncultured Rhodoblastus sp.]
MSAAPAGAEPIRSFQQSMDSQIARNRIMQAVNWIPATALTVILGIVLVAVQLSHF